MRNTLKERLCSVFNLSLCFGLLWWHTGRVTFLCKNQFYFNFINKYFNLLNNYIQWNWGNQIWNSKTSSELFLLDFRAVTNTKLNLGFIFTNCLNRHFPNKYLGCNYRSEQNFVVHKFLALRIWRWLRNAQYQYFLVLFRKYVIMFNNVLKFRFNSSLSNQFLYFGTSSLFSFLNLKCWYFILWSRTPVQSVIVLSSYEIYCFPYTYYVILQSTMVFCCANFVPFQQGYKMEVNIVTRWEYHSNALPLKCMSSHHVYL